MTKPQRTGSTRTHRFAPASLRVTEDQHQRLVAAQAELAGQFGPPSLNSLIRAAIDVELARAGATTATGEYTTDVGSYPPGCRTRRAARDRIRAVAGHTCSGTGRGTRWTVDVDAYARHHDRQRPAPVRLVAALDDDELAMAALVSMRSTRRAS